MCLLLFYVDPDASDSELYLVLVSVRDEIYNRPTKLAEFWDKHQDVIGGMDLEPSKKGGSWLVMNKNGKIGVLLSILQPDEEMLPDKKGRGFLAVDYVTGHKDFHSYLSDLSREGSDYNGFFLVTMDYSSFKDPKMACYSNSSASPPVTLRPGIHAFGNSITPETPWPKVTKAKEDFRNIIIKYPTLSTKDTLVKELFLLLQNRTRYPLDESMKKQGKGKPTAFMDKLSAIFVSIPEANYGSRCHTVILVDAKGNVDYFEHSRPEHLSPDAKNQWFCHQKTFKLHA